MKAFVTACALLFTLATVRAESLDAELDEFSNPRFFVANFTSSLIQVNSTILAYGLIFVAIVGAAAVALSFLFLESAGAADSSESYGSYGQYYSQYARSAKDGFGYNGMNVIQWISMLQDVYEKFDYNDLDCQKRLVCEVMREPEFYGTVARKFKAGFQYAKFLEVLELPDEMRELLDEYLDANARSEDNKDCEEFFQCPYSIKESMKRNAAATNNL